MPLMSLASNLTGKVTVLSTGTPVQGAIVILQHNLTVHIDTTDAEGNYAFIYFEGMKFEVKVIKDHYNILKDSIDIPEDMTIIHDFQLTSPTLNIIPESINDTLHSGVPYQRWITVTNNGDGPLEWHTWAQMQYKKTKASSAEDCNIFQKIHSASFPLKDNSFLGSTGYAFSFGSNHLFFSFNTDNPSNMNIICADTMGVQCSSFDATDNGIIYFICPLGYDNSDLMKMDINTGEITDIGSSNPNIPFMSFWTGLTCDRNTGMYYACATNWDESYLYAIDITTGASTVIGSTGLHYLQGIAIDGTGQMYGIDAATDKAYLIDKATGAATALGPLGFDSYYRHDIAWNPEQDIIYVVANYDDNTPGAPPFSELRIMDRTNGNTYVVGYFADKVDGLCFTGEGYPSWLVVGAPVEGIIPADSSVNIPVTFDWNYIPPQKDITFQGNICFISNPDVGTATIPVTYNIVPPPPHYYLAGTATHSGQPLAGVTVTATKGSYSQSATTGADGTFWLSLTSSGTYAITAEIAGYNTYHGSCVIQDEYTPFDINITAPTMAINPLSIEVECPQLGQTITRTLTITNNGDGPLLWNGETETGFKKPSPKGSTGYAFSLGPEKYFFSFDTDNPSISNIISTETISPAGGTFDDRHTGFMYIIDANDSHLKKVNAATGNVTDIGLCNSTVGGQQSWTGIQVNKLQGEMYGITTDNNESYLYLIDPSTGSATVIGPTGIPNCADFAIVGGDQMYGIDIVGDNAYTIDMSTGASALLGPLGFNAGNVMGMSWDSETNNVYFTSYNNTTSKSELYILDKASGNATMVGSLLDNEVDGLAFSGNLYTWLTIDPKFGTVPPGDSVVVTASIDGSWFPPQKDYDNGTITFTSDPDVDTVVVPVTILPIVVHGILTGNITHAGIPVPNVTITATHDGINYTAVSDSTGIYYIGDLPMGTYDVTAEATGYNSYSAYSIEVYEYQYLPINLTAPTMNISPDSLAISLNQGETGYVILHMFNGGDGMLEWHSTLITNLDANGKRSITPPQFITEPKISRSATSDISLIHTNAIDTPVRALWDVLFSFNGNYTNQPGVETDGQYIYTSSSWVGGIGSWFHKYDMNGNWIEDFDIAGATGICDLAYDGQYFYGGANGSTIYQMDFTNKVLVGSINTSVPAIRHIAYDSQNDGFWVGGWSDLQLVDRNGSVINSGTTGLSGMDGSAYDPWTIGGPYLWIFDQGGNGVDIHQYNIANGALTGVMHDASDIPGFVAGSSFACGLCISNTAVPGKIALIGNMQNDLQTIFAYDLGGTTPWITIIPASGTLAEGTSQDIMIPIDATNLSSGIYTASITFTSDPNVGTIIIPVTLHVQPVAKVTIAMLANIQAGPVSVPVHASNIINMGSFQFSIEYNPALLTYTGTSNWYPGINDVTVANPSPGHLTFVWAAENNGIYIPDDNLFNIDFEWSGLDTVSALVWSDNPTPREFGDFNGNIFVPTYINGLVSGTSGYNSTVSIEDVIVPNGSGMQTIAVPVHAQFAINPDCFQFTIEYDYPLMFLGVANWNPSIVDSVMVEETTPGHITFQWCAETQGLNITDGHFFDLLFRWPEFTDIWMTFPIVWSEDPMPRNFSWDYGTPIPVNYINGSASGDVIGGINKTTKESVTIYPNPASDYLNVEVGNDIRKINVINNLGITVYEQNITGKKTITLNISGYRTGNYIVQLITKDGQTINRKMMKQ